MRMRRVGPVALVLAAGMVGTGCEPPRCDPPYRAVAGQQTYPAETGSWPIAGEVRPWAPLLDTDGDGAADTFQETGDVHRAVIRRASGDLTLTVGPDEQLNVFSTIASLGDLDGDGRTEVGLVVDSADSTRSGHVVVRGGLANGSYDVHAAGVAILPEDGEDLRWPQPAGDVDGDGHDDVMVVRRTGTRVWSGADLDLDPAAVPVPPAWELDRLASTTAVPISPDRSALALVEESTGSSGETVVTVTLWSDGLEMAFTTADGEIAVTAPIYFTSAAIVTEGDQRWLTLGMNYRNLYERWAWDLDDLCAAAPPP